MQIAEQRDLKILDRFELVAEEFRLDGLGYNFLIGIAATGHAQ